MNKSELVATVAKEAGVSQVDAGRTIDATLSTIQKTLKRGGDVSLTGFGKFSVTKRSARTGRNPQTGEAIKIRASKSPKFSPGTTFKQTVAGSRSR